MKKISQALFLGALIFAPLAFGTVEHWSLLTLQLLIAAALVSFCLQRFPPNEKLLEVPGLLPLCLLLGWMALQIVPLPLALVKLLSPETYQVYKPVYDMLDGDKWMPLSVYPKGTVLEGVRIFTYVVFYVLTVQLLSNGRLLKQTVTLCCWLAIGIALLAILQKFSSPDKIYWLRSAPAGTLPVGPWIYRSQYCGFVELLAPLVLALMLYYRPLLPSDEPLRKRIVAFFSKDDSGNYYILLGFGLLVLASSVFVSLARGGIISLSLSFLVFFLLLGWKESRYSGLFSMMLVTCLVLAVSWFGWEPIVERFDKMFSVSGEVTVDRIPIWENTWQLFKDFVLTGSGFGTFIAVFPHYRTVPGEAIFDHAHNDYLELLTDGGIIAFFLVGWFFFSVVRQGWRMLRRRRDRYSILLSIGALTSIVAMLIHSISDFNMHNGAVGLYFFFICGLLVSVGHTRFHYQLNATLLPKSRWLSQNILLFAGAVFFFLVIIGQGGATAARYHYQSVKNIYLSRQLSKERLEEVADGLQLAAKLDPFEGMYPYLQGDVQRLSQQPEKALASYVLAALKDPLDGAFLQRIGLILPEERQRDAEYLLAKGAERTLKKDQLLLTHVEWLLTMRQRDKAIAVLQQGIADKPKLVSVVLPLLQSFTFTREELVAVLPQTVESWVECGNTLEKIGNLEDALFFRLRALDYLDGADKIQPVWFSHLYNYYKKQKDEDKALEILRLGIEKLPNYPRFHEWLGDYYAGEGIAYRAEEEYQQVLLVEPHNEAIRRKIEKLLSLREK